MTDCSQNDFLAVPSREWQSGRIRQRLAAEHRREEPLQLRLPMGVYPVYIIAWGKRETREHRGNLTEYFAKMTLTVK
jgi:hypothetical protein